MLRSPVRKGSESVEPASQAMTSGFSEIPRSNDTYFKPVPNVPVGFIREMRGTVLPEIYLRLLASQSLSRGIRMNTAAEIISISVIGLSQINWIPFALRIARPRLSSNICPSTKPISRGGNG